MKDIYIITHGVDMDGVSCGALLLKLPHAYQSIKCIKSYNKLYKELEKAEELLKLGYVVYVTDLCFYKDNVRELVAKLLKQYPETFIVLDHHVETIELLQEVQKTHSIGCSEYSIKHFDKTKSAVVVVYEYIKAERLCDKVLELEEVVYTISDWDTSYIDSPRGIETAKLLQYVFLAEPVKVFVKFITNPNWKQVLNTYYKKSLEPIFEEMCNQVLNKTFKKDIQGKDVTILQFPAEFKFKQYTFSPSVRDIAEIICIEMSSQGRDVIAIIDYNFLLFKGTHDYDYLSKFGLEEYCKQKRCINFDMINIIGQVIQA